MKHLVRMVVLLFMLGGLAGAAWGDGDCQGKQRLEFSPDPSSYQQINKEQAKASKNYIPADQHEASVKGEPRPGTYEIQENSGK